MSKRIELQKLNVYYSSFLAVEDVNMVIEPKAITAFIGPSGCGKSTLIRTLNRMHEVIPGARVEGQLLMDGEDVYGPDVDPVRVRRQVGMVFQRPNPFPTMSIKDNVLSGYKLNNSRMSKTEAEELTEKALVGANLWNEVKDRLDKPGSGLSGGQQQRLCIARAIAVEPDVILMDEPLGALDALTREKMQSLVLDLWKETGKTIILITHSVEEALLLGERLLVMAPRPGRIHKEYRLPFAEMGVGADLREVKKHPDYAKTREEILSMIWEMEEEIMGRTEESA